MSNGKEGMNLDNPLEQWKQLVTQNPKRVIEEAQLALQSADTSQIEQGEIHYWIALSHRYLTKLDLCLKHAYKAEQLFLQIDNEEGLARIYNLIGVVYFYNGFYEKSMKEFVKAKELALEHSMIATLCRIENNMGEVYRETEAFEYANDHYQLALKLAKQTSETYFQAIILENLGQLYVLENRLDEGHNYLMESYKLLATLTDESAVADVENKLGALFIKKGKYGQAEQYFQKAFNRLNPDGNQMYLTEVLLNLADLVVDYDTSYEQLLHEAQHIAQSIDAYHLLKKCFQRLSTYYENHGNYQESLMNYKLFHQMEQVIEAAIVRNKLELLRVELNQSTDLHKLARLNEQLSYEIEHQRLLFEQLEQSNQQLSEEMYTDELTQVFNRKGLFEYIRTIREAEHLVLLLDIDYFKKYNDVHGHVQGDQALQKVAASLQSSLTNLKIEGCVTRMGGEEFLIIAELHNEEQATLLTHTLRDNLFGQELYYSLTKSTEYLTVSGGGIITSQHLMTHFKEIYEKIDKVLYDSKVKGRDQIQIYKR